MKTEIKKSKYQVYETRNETWGFYGTTQANYGFGDKDAKELFGYAVFRLSTEGKQPAAYARDFLDATYGRHLSDNMSFYGSEKGISLEQAMHSLDKCLADEKNNGCRWFATFKKWVQKDYDQEEFNQSMEG